MERRAVRFEPQPSEFKACRKREVHALMEARLQTAHSLFDSLNHGHVSCCPTITPGLLCFLHPGNTLRSYLVLLTEDLQDV